MLSVPLSFTRLMTAAQLLKPTRSMQGTVGNTSSRSGNLSRLTGSESPSTKLELLCHAMPSRIGQRGGVLFGRNILTSGIVKTPRSLEHENGNHKAGTIDPALSAPSDATKKERTLSMNKELNKEFILHEKMFKEELQRRGYVDSKILFYDNEHGLIALMPLYYEDKEIYEQASNVINAFAEQEQPHITVCVSDSRATDTTGSMAIEIYLDQEHCLWKIGYAINRQNEIVFKKAKHYLGADAEFQKEQELKRFSSAPEVEPALVGNA